METNKNLIDETIDVTDLEPEIEGGSGKGLVIALGVGAALLVTGLGYKYVVKPLVAKAKAKKEAKEDDSEKEVYEKFEGEVEEDEVEETEETK